MLQSSFSTSQDSLDLPSILSTFSADEPEDESSPTAVKSTKSQRPTECLICGNSANGHHYEVASCNGCKTFFRRMCVSDRSFECKARRDCFDLTKRKVPLKCRACRHQKCISVGMNPLAMEVDEKAASSSNFKKLVKRAQDQEPDDDCQVTAVVNKMQIIKPVDSIESKMQNITDMLVYLETKVERFRKSAYNPHWNEFSGLEYLLESECRIGFGDRFGPMPGWPLRRDQLGPPRPPKPASPGEPRDSKHSPNRKQWFFYNLLTTVEYAKTFMFFHRLNSRDKLILTRHVALACTNLYISYSSVKRNLEVIIEPDGSEPMAFNDTHYSASVMSVAPLIRCQIKNIEYLLLKAIVLCNPAVPDLSAKSQEIISLERVKYANALFNYCLRSRSDGPAHFAQLVQIIDVLERQQRMQKDLHLLLVAPKVAKLPKDLVMRVIEDIMDS